MSSGANDNTKPPQSQSHAQQQRSQQSQPQPSQQQNQRASGNEQNHQNGHAHSRRRRGGGKGGKANEAEQDNGNSKTSQSMRTAGGRGRSPGRGRGGGGRGGGRSRRGGRGGRGGDAQASNTNAEVSTGANTTAEATSAPPAASEAAGNTEEQRPSTNRKSKSGGGRRGGRGRDNREDARNEEEAANQRRAAHEDNDADARPQQHQQQQQQNQPSHGRGTRRGGPRGRGGGDHNITNKSRRPPTSASQRRSESPARSTTSAHYATAKPNSRRGGRSTKNRTPRGPDSSQADTPHDRHHVQDQPQEPHEARQGEAADGKHHSTNRGRSRPNRHRNDPHERRHSRRADEEDDQGSVATGEPHETYTGKGKPRRRRGGGRHKKRGTTEGEETHDADGDDEPHAPAVRDGEADQNPHATTPTDAAEKEAGRNEPHHKQPRGKDQKPHHDSTRRRRRHPNRRSRHEDDDDEESHTLDQDDDPQQQQQKEPHKPSAQGRRQHQTHRRDASSKKKQNGERNRNAQARSVDAAGDNNETTTTTTTTTAREGHPDSEPANEDSAPLSSTTFDAMEAKKDAPEEKRPFSKPRHQDEEFPIENGKNPRKQHSHKPSKSPVRILKKGDKPQKKGPSSSSAKLRRGGGGGGQDAPSSLAAAAASAAAAAAGSEDYYIQPQEDDYSHDGGSEGDDDDSHAGRDKHATLLNEAAVSTMMPPVDAAGGGGGGGGGGGEEEEDPTTTQQFAALPAQEVSITAATSLIRRSPSASPSRSSSVVSNLMALGESSHNNSGNTMTNGGGTTTNDKKTKSKRKKGGGGGRNGRSEKEMAKAAKAFNRSVRECVENSDPDAMREILHDPANRNYALDKNVLETVMKAYVMAAMFEDALYCLRNCALPGTLTCPQAERILQCLPQNLRNSSAYVAADMINALCIATQFDGQNRRTYFLRIVRGIALEFLEEATSARDRICSAPCERLVRSALCVVDARFKRGKKASDLVVMPGNQLGVFVPDNSFMDNRGIQAGDAVSILPYAGPYPMSAESLDRNMLEATVSQAAPLMILRLQDKTNTALYTMLTETSAGNVYRIDKLANRMGFNRQLSAAVSICDTHASTDGGGGRRDQRRPCVQLIQAITAMDENIDRVMLGAANGKYDVNTKESSGGGGNGENSTTAEICSRAVPVFPHREDGPKHAPPRSGNGNGNTSDQEKGASEDEEEEDQDTIRGNTRVLLERLKAFDDLNASQKLSIEGAATNRLTLVQGPPGTGKTAVAIRILQFWAKLSFSLERNESPILATSDSNIAVDNLVEGCANAGLRVVRLGRPEAIRPELLRYCIDRPNSQGGPGGPGGSGPGGGNNGYYGGGGGGGGFKEKMKRLKAAQVVCCTCIGSGGDILDNMTFERVLVDEATQATEPAVLVPLTRGCRQLVLVGDHCQLPPTVLSTRAEEEGLGVPLFSRMVACGVPPFMLDTQYRMHPSIAMFPSDLFYGGKLLNGVSAPERRPLAGFPWPREEFPVAFVPVTHGVEMDDGVSKYNEAEAAAACDAVMALLQGGQCTVSDIAVVTPYAAQVRLIRRKLRGLVHRPPYVEVSSVDGFQGREKEAVIFSAVRSNDFGAVGFVSDWRRVNVSFTRARRALIVIGNDQTLRRGDPDTWMPWLAWADAHGVNMDKPGVPRGRYEADQLRRVRGGTTAAEMLKDVLERQQAQLKVAEQQLEKAERNAAGHIIGTSDDENMLHDDDDPTSLNAATLQKDLAMLANADGCWDDSDDENKIDLQTDKREIRPSQSRTSLRSSMDERSGDENAVADAWDL